MSLPPVSGGPRAPQRLSQAATRGLLAVLALAVAGCAGLPAAVEPSVQATATTERTADAAAAPAPRAAAAAGRPVEQPTSPGRGVAAPAGEQAAPATSKGQVAVIDSEPPRLERAIVDGYQAPPPPSRVRLDPAEDSRRNDLWERVRAGFALPELRGELVTKWEQRYGARPDDVRRMTERGGRYLFYIVEEIERRGLPSDLALLPFIESAFNPHAESRARASGMWQFMPATGRDFELRQNLFRDDRRDVLESTRAALDYLQKLVTLFDGDWHLALAAYNWGQGNVMRAIERNRRAGRPTGYEDLRMPEETRNYVPKLQAVKNLVARPEAFGMVLPPLENHPYFLSVVIERDIDVVLAARLAEIPIDDFRQLNPQMNKPVILAAGTPRVLLPYDNANIFLRNLAEHRGQLASWTAWVAPRTVRPAEAATLVGMPEGQLREVNRIPPRMLVKAGSTLLVPRAAHARHDVNEHLADHATIALAPEPRPMQKLQFTARNGDTVAAVARRYRVSPAQVAQWNGVSPQAHFTPGQSVIVMLAQRTGPPAATGRDATQRAAAKGTRAGKAPRAGKPASGHRASVTQR